MVAYRGGGDRAVGLGTGAVAYFRCLVAYLLPRGVAARAVGARGDVWLATGVLRPAAPRVVACTWGGKLRALSPLVSTPPIKIP